MEWKNTQDKSPKFCAKNCFLGEFLIVLPLLYTLQLDLMLENLFKSILSDRHTWLAYMSPYGKIRRESNWKKKAELWLILLILIRIKKTTIVYTVQKKAADNILLDPIKILRNHLFFFELLFFTWSFIFLMFTILNADIDFRDGITPFSKKIWAHQTETIFLFLRHIFYLNNFERRIWTKETFLVHGK